MAARVFGITSVVIGMLGFYVAFTARDFRKNTVSKSGRKRMPGWVARLWFVAWSVLWISAGIWALWR